MSGLRGALWAGVPVNVPDLVTVCVTAAATTVSGPECGSACAWVAVAWSCGICGYEHVMVVCVEPKAS